MLIKIWTASLIFLAGLTFCAWLVLVCHEKDIRPLRDIGRFFKKQSKVGRIILGTFFLVLILYGSVKPGSGGGDGGANNIEMGIRPGGLEPGNLPGLSRPNVGDFEAIMSTNTTRTLTAEDFERGFVMTRIGTDETFDFTAPPSATVYTDWRAFGAAEDWIYIAFTNWVFQIGTNDVECLRVFSFGQIEPLIREADGTIATNNWFAPFRTSLGIVPEANWGRLAESDLPSQFWYAITPQNSLLLTWQNVLLNRDTSQPVSFQIEFFTSGQFIYRYDLSCLDSEDAIATVGASFAGNIWTTNSIPTNVTSMAFYPLSEEDAFDQDRDGDGLTLTDELFVYGTDPMLWDSDFDGLSDGAEVAGGTNPTGRDSDNDGLVDGSDPDSTTITSLEDLDGDGIPDAYENHWFGGTNVVDSADEFGVNGFNVGFELASGINPTNGTESAFMSTNRIAAWKITDGFIAQNTGAMSNIYERTFHIARNGSWEQFFLSSKPDRAGAWRLEGLALDWEDSEGESGTATVSPAGDSLYLPISPNSPANLTIRFRQTATTMSCRTPLYLLAFSPNVEVEDAQRITTSNGIWTVAEITEATSFAASIDRSERPCKAALYPQETAAELSTDSGKLKFQAAGTLQVNAPGVYQMPTMDLSAYNQSIVRGKRRLSSLSPSATNNCYLAFLNPSVSYGVGHHRGGAGLVYDSTSDTYSETYEYPLDSRCLWRAWHSDSSGGYVCDCKPELSIGFDFSDYVDITTNIVVSGESATGTISIGGVTVWSDTATHDVSTEGGGSGTELLSDDGCDACSGCEEGNCDSLEGPGLGSLKFRIPLGVPRKGQVSGFAWFMTKGPLAVGIDTLQVLSRRDTNVSDTTSSGTRTIVCGDNRGRTLTIESIENGIRVTITETASGALEHTWELMNVGGASSQIRLRKISRLDNTMSDETYIYDDGDWTKFDNISQTSEKLVATGDINEAGGKREERILRDANNALLSYTVTVSERFGTFDNAVLRETYYAEKSWGEDNWNESFASYYTDIDNPKRNGNVRLEWGNARAWRFSAYDTGGRTILTLDQFDGSECPERPLDDLNADAFDGQDILQWLRDQWFTAIATVCDYAPLAGDDAVAADADKVRTESRYLVNGGSVTLIGRTWTRYTHGTANGYATDTVETTTAGTQDAGIDDTRNAVTIETHYDDDAFGIPLVLRGKIATATDSDGITTTHEHSFASGVLTTTERKFKDGLEAPTRTVTERCATYGNTIREWSVHTASGLAFDEKRHLYDDKNRLISIIYADGSFTTNAYSCCRLLWSQDRSGAKTLRSAKTGEDHLYYATEEVSLAELPHVRRYAPYDPFLTADYNAYRAIQHFMDALGRETNTVTRTCKSPGAAANPDYSYRGWRSGESVAYPYGVSDYEVSTDIRGNETTTIRYAYQDSEVVETIETNKTTIATTYRNGPTLLREEWPDEKWKETETSTSYDANGCRVDTVTTTASDHDATTLRTTYRDFLGRTVREVTSLSDVAYTYDGASSRILKTSDSVSGESITRLYNTRGEAIGQMKNGVTSVSDTDYEVESNVLWRVTSQVVSGSVTNASSIVKERLTGLSDALRSEMFAYQNGVLALQARSFFDATNSILTEVSESATSGTTTTKSKFGIAYETTTPGGTTSNFFDPFGRVFYTEKDGRSVDWIGRNDYGDAEEFDTFYASDGNVYAEFYGYNNFGNRIVATNALGAVTVSAYDTANRLASSGGAVYSVRYGYDTEGRRRWLSTTRDGATWDDTAWTFNASNGLCTAKTYADNSTVAYTHTPDGKPLRTTYASGRWCENAYNAKRELVAKEYSDGEVCAFAYDEFSHQIAASNGVAVIQLARNDYGQVTNETVTVGGESVSIKREFDAYGRLISNDGSAYAYDSAGRLASISNSIAAVEYQYSADGLDAGYSVTLSNGVMFTRSVARDTYRRSLVTNIVNSAAGTTVESLAYTYDALNRPICRNTDTFGYNDRSEVTSATISGVTNGYGYDEIGNSTDWTANNLNQYAEFSYDLDGNLLSDGVRTFSYDAANRLKTVSINDILVLTNFYDAKSRRVKKVAQEATTTFFYDDWNLIEERIAYTNGTSSTIHYFWGKDLSGTLQGAGCVGGLLYLTVDDAVYVPFYDNLGNITHYLDANGNTVAQYTYDAFGKFISQTGSLADFFRHRFSTKYFDSETDLYYYGYRFYHPALMRWLTRDPIEEEGGLNLYMYVDNAPLVRIDVKGLSSYRIGTQPPAKKIVLDRTTWNSMPGNSGYAIRLRAKLTALAGNVTLWPDAAAHLRHFLDNSGTTYTINFQKMNNESVNAKNHLMKELNCALTYAEKLADPRGMVSMVTTEEDSAKNSDGNWLYAVGKYSTWAVGDVFVCDDKYYMIWEFHFRDVYDWKMDSGLRGGLVTDREMALLHRYGVAKEYEMVGVQEMRIMWTRGQRVNAGATFLPPVFKDPRRTSKK